MTTTLTLLANRSRTSHDIHLINLRGRKSENLGSDEDSTVVSWMNAFSVSFRPSSIRATTGQALRLCCIVLSALTHAIVMLLREARFKNLPPYGVKGLLSVGSAAKYNYI